MGLKLKHNISAEESNVGNEEKFNTAPSPALVLDMPVNVRSFSLALMTLLATIFVLNWASAIFIPLMLGVLISYALTPLVDQLSKWRIPRTIGAAVLLLFILGGAGSLVYSFSDDATKLIGTLPDAVHKFHLAMIKTQGTTETTMSSMQRTATRLEQVASETGSVAPDVPRGVTRVQIEKTKLNIKDYLWMGTKGVVAFVGQLTMVMFLAYFILVSGDSFRRKLIKISGPALSRKKVTLLALDEIAKQIQRFLLVKIATSFLVGVVTWLAFLWIGFEHAAIWGIAAGLFNTVPYLGPAMIGCGTALVAFSQYGTLGMALMISGVSLFITGLEGYLLTPWLTGRASRMSPVVIFVGVLFWGWLWGVWGLLLGVPIIMIVKAVCDHVEDLKPIGELLGD